MLWEINFYNKPHNKVYYSSVNIEVVEAYLSGKDYEPKWKGYMSEAIRKGYSGRTIKKYRKSKGGDMS